MRNISLFVFILGLFSKPSFGQHADVHAMQEQVRTLFNANEGQALYALTGTTFRQQLNERAFQSVFLYLQNTMGKWEKSIYVKKEGKVEQYLLECSKGKQDFFLSLDEQGKIETILFRPNQSVLEKTRAVPSSNPLLTAMDKKVERIVRPYISKDNTVGLCIGIVKGDSIWVYGYGETAKGSGKLPDGNSIFEIGSISKTFTATLLALEVQAGKMQLKDPVNRYLPDSIPSLSYAGDAITMANLSNHSSGLPRLPGDLFSGRDFRSDNPYNIYDKNRLYHFLKGFKTTRIPGVNFEYSNLGVGLLGQIIADYNHTTYEALIQERIANPLGMKSTTMSLNMEAKNRFVQGYNESGGRVPAWDFQALAGAGAIRSTINDMLLYLKANLGMAPSSLQNAMNLCKQITFESADAKVGLGWFKSTRFNKAWWHNGMTGGFASFAMIDLERQLGVIILSNSAVNVDALGLEMMK